MNYYGAYVCDHCKTAFYGTACPACGLEVKGGMDDYFADGTCAYCGGRLVDITISCRKVICERCGKEDK